MKAPRDPDAATCLDEATVAELFLGSLDREARARVERHVAGCAECRRMVSELARTSWGQRTGGEGLTFGASDPLERGATIGRYVILDRIGHGAMGVVYAAYNPELDRKVALKLVRGDVGIGPDAQERLQREAQAMARLEHPNVVRVYDIGVSGARIFVAMELVDGVSFRQWLARSPSWREVLAAFAAAGAGLAAAHAAGLVHGDFKPDNVLRTAEGRVCVTDFGLASPLERRVGSERAATSEEELSDDTAWSRIVGGTPAYMAPELWRGEAGGAASDQFAFCVALHEALFGVRPFAGMTMAELAAHVKDGARASLPKKTPVPAAVRAAVLRGLQPDPAARFPSMSALVDVLRREGSRGRRRRVVVVAVATLALIGGLGAAGTMRARTVCRGAEAIAAGAWSAEDQARVERALRATGVPFAEDAWRSVRRMVNDHLARWSQARTEACEATKVRREQSEELLELRLQCLDNKLLETRALVDVLAHADTAVATRAVQAAASLPELGACADARALRGMPRPPLGIQPTLERFNRQMAKARSLGRVMRYPQALEAAVAADELAKSTHFAPVEAEAQVYRADIERALRQAQPAKRSALAALRLAETGRVDAVKANAAIVMAEIVGLHENQVEEGAEWTAFAEAVLDRLPSEAKLRLQLLGVKGELLEHQRRSAEALPLTDQALAIAARSLASVDPNVIMLLVSSANILMTQGRLDEAQARIERANAVALQIFGPNWPGMASIWETRGNIAMRRERLEEALADHRHALTIAERFGLAAEMNVALINIGGILTELDRLDEAEQLLKRALAGLAQLYGDNDPYRGTVWIALGEIARHRKQFDKALVSNREAKRIFRRAGLGQVNAYVADAIGMDGLIRLDAGQTSQAVVDLERSVAIYDKVFGRDQIDDQVDQLLVLVGLGQARIDLGAAATAVAPLERAVELVKKQPGGPAQTADAQFQLARALWQSGGDRVRARSLAGSARDLYHKAGARGAERLAKVERWLAERNRS